MIKITWRRAAVYSKLCNFTLVPENIYKNIYEKSRELNSKSDVLMKMTIKNKQFSLSCLGFLCTISFLSIE